MKKILIRFEQLPEGLRGSAIQDPEDPSFYIVVCDSTRHIQSQRFTFGHELAHIFCNHFNTEDTLLIYPGGSNNVSADGTHVNGKLYNSESTSEKEADAKAWYYYRRFRKYFLQAKETGSAIIVAQ
jgi:hypothetical protein